MAAIMPIIAAQPLIFSAFSLNIVGVSKLLYRVSKQNEESYRCRKPEKLSHRFPQESPK